MGVVLIMPRFAILRMCTYGIFCALQGIYVSFRLRSSFSMLDHALHEGKIIVLFLLSIEVFLDFFEKYVENIFFGLSSFRGFFELSQYLD